MTMQIRFLPCAACVVILFSVPSFAQTFERRQTNQTPQAEEQLPVLPPNATSLEIVANEIGLLRKSLQALNIRLRDISEKVRAPDANQSGSPNDKQNRISLNLELLTRAEQRAEICENSFSN